MREGDERKHMTGYSNKEREHHMREKKRRREEK